MAYKLFYPASLLPHKNHQLLLQAEVIEYFLRNEIKLFLTIDASQFPLESKGTVVCLGRIERGACIRFLMESDAFFLSEFESWASAIEAADARKPVITFDLPYSRELLGLPVLHQTRCSRDNPICCALANFLRSAHASPSCIGA